MKRPATNHNRSLGQQPIKRQLTDNIVLGSLVCSRDRIDLPQTMSAVPGAGYGAVLVLPNQPWSAKLM